MVGQLELVQVSSSLSRFVALKLKPPDRADFFFVLFLVFLPLFSSFFGTKILGGIEWRPTFRGIVLIAPSLKLPFLILIGKKFSSFTFIEENPGRRKSTTTNIDATTVTFSPFYKLLARPEQLALFTLASGTEVRGVGREGGVDHARKNTPKIWNSSLRRAMKKNLFWIRFGIFFSDPVAFLVLICISSPVRETASTAELSWQLHPPNVEKWGTPKTMEGFELPTSSLFVSCCWLLFFLSRWNARLRVLIIFAIQVFFLKFWSDLGKAFKFQRISRRKKLELVRAQARSHKAPSS